MIIKFFDEFEGVWIDISGQTGSSLEYDGSGWTSTPEYRVVIGTISQTGTSAPTINPYRDSGYIAGFTLTYVGTGEYNIESADNMFDTTNNFWCNFSNHSSINSDWIVIQTYVVNATNLKIFTYKGGSLTNEILLNTPFELRIYGN
jgi:predicted small secreted protein